MSQAISKFDALAAIAAAAAAAMVEEEKEEWQAIAATISRSNDMSNSRQSKGCTVTGVTAELSLLKRACVRVCVCVCADARGPRQKARTANA